MKSHSTDDLSMSITDIRKGIKEAMDNDTLIDRNDTYIGNITRLVYLGDSLEEVYAYGTVTRGTAGGGRSDMFIPILAVGLIGTGIIALLLLLARRRRRTMTQRQLDQCAAITAASDASSTSSMGDPPGSFHQGYYHYTKDGVRYLSQYCFTCRETERQLALGHGLETISEDEQFFEGRNRLIAANSKDLGCHHSTMNVHNCSSATCEHCRNRERDVTFISWRKAQRSEITHTDVTDVASNTQRSKHPKSIEV